MNAFNHPIARITLLMLVMMSLAAGGLAPVIQEMPPRHPLGRGTVKKWETRVRVSVGEAGVAEPFGDAGDESNAFTCEATELVFPLVIEGNYTRTNPQSIRVTGMIGDRWQTSDLPWKLRGPRADGTAEVVLSFPALEASTIGMEVSWVSESWTPTIDEAQAARVTWPQTWPPEVAQYLEPSKFIDSRSTALEEFVEAITNGKQRMVPPFLAAKEITRGVVTHFRMIDEGMGGVRKLSSIEKSLRSGRGTRADMVCLAVASLRAAGIPARPVVGVGQYVSSGLAKDVNSWLLWCEFYLPGAGWVAFDPNQMRGKGIELKGLEVRWPWFGYEKSLDERTALAYRLMIPGSPDPEECFTYDQGLWNTTPDGEGGVTGAQLYRTLCFWGWMSATCEEECETQTSSITRINRTGSLFHR